MGFGGMVLGVKLDEKPGFGLNSPEKKVHQEKSFS
jgi:hypothetical protein